jgi:integrase/recombinase XerD
MNSPLPDQLDPCPHEPTGLARERGEGGASEGGSLPSFVAHAPGGASMLLPRVVGEAGGDAGRFTLEFFAARIPNLHTRKAYGRAVHAFCSWCEAQRVGLREIVPTTIAAYYAALQRRLSLPSLKLHSAAIRHWLDYLTERGALPNNPALSVRTPRLVVDEGKTPVLERDEARALFAELEADGSLLGMRDRAMFAVMLFGFVRVGALVKLRVRDFEDEGETAWLRIQEKGGKERRIPCHHQTRAYLRQYIERAQLDPKAREPLFQSAPRTSSKLSGRALNTNNVLAAVKRRCSDVGLPSTICNHSFRATGLTLHQESGGRLEDAQELAGHAEASTTRLYIRTKRRLAQKEVERVQL